METTRRVTSWSGTCSNVEVGMRLQALTPMTAHESRVTDLLELPDEDRALRGYLPNSHAWSLPGLVPSRPSREELCGTSTLI